MSKNTGGPAFPFSHVFKEQAVFCDGMTIRDYFAAKAMHGLIESNGTASGWIAAAAYAIADAMLEAREK